MTSVAGKKPEQKAKRTEPKRSSSRPTVDFPIQLERICHPSYAVRVGVPSTMRRVEIAVNQDAWKPCREAIGYWWYDWDDMTPGEHELVVRAQEEGGDWLLSETRQCVIHMPDPS
jgi:hypothetical protein